MSSNTQSPNQGPLPKVVPLLRHVPNRTRFDWKQFKPGAVASIGDLPPYLVMGGLDTASFVLGPEGWQATWRVPVDIDGWLCVEFKASTNTYTLLQSWNGIDGGLSQCSAKTPLDNALAQGLYQKFPTSWDNDAKARLETKYQLNYIPQVTDAYAFVGIPDGAFRTIAFIATAKNLRPICAWMRAALAASNPAYPMSVEAQLVVQVVNYVEGRAPDWTSNAPRCFHQALLDTGLSPLTMPVREESSDGSAAWTVRRLTYVVFVNVPFTGLEAFLGSIEAINGFVRPTTAPELRAEFRPVIFPQGLETQVQSLSTWDPEMTIRSTLVFPGAAGIEQAAASWATHSGQAVEQTLAMIEQSSAATIQQIEAMIGLPPSGT